MEAIYEAGDANPGLENSDDTRQFQQLIAFCTSNRSSRFHMHSIRSPLACVYLSNRQPRGHLSPSPHSRERDSTSQVSRVYVLDWHRQVPVRQQLRGEEQ